MGSIQKVLVANRGEIARRVFRTCRRLGIGTVAVASDADAGTWHVAEADEAVILGGAAARDSYLRADAVIEAARRTGADAIHPGYGFLSENAEFAEAVQAAGLAWIGPPASAMRALGAKVPARQLAASLGVPTVPGYDGPDDDDALIAAARRMGAPVLIKASAGGGGRGMRRVDDLSEIAEAVAAARREAVAGFGDGRLLLERYVERPRHIEVQVIADAHGAVVHLGERECSIQRRHQKIVEEAPSPAVGPELRAQLGDAAVKLARAVGYESAGTVEFIVGPDGDWYFLEMNTRLQVEHPVTEAVTGLDLVELQIAVAEGKPLPIGQEDVVLRGHAVEVRLCAEDPARDFVGSTGPLVAFDLDAEARVDTGVRAGDVIGPHYDSLLAKVIVRGEDRADACRRLRRALGRSWVVGLAHNLPLLRDIAADEAWLAGELDTGFLGRRGLPRPPPVDLARAASVAAAIDRALLDTDAQVGVGWRIGGAAAVTATWGFGAEVIGTEADGAGVVVGGSRRSVRVVSLGDGSAQIEEGGVRRSVRWARDGGTGPLADGETVWLHLGDAEGMVRLLPRFPALPAAEEVPGSCVAPSPGVVRAVAVEVGQEVEAGAVLVVLEAMKMEHALRSPVAGVVTAVRVVPGDAVDGGTLLVQVEGSQAVAGHFG